MAPWGPGPRAPCPGPRVQRQPRSCPSRARLRWGPEQNPGSRGGLMKSLRGTETLRAARRCLAGQGTTPEGRGDPGHDARGVREAKTPPVKMWAVRGRPAGRRADLAGRGAVSGPAPGSCGLGKGRRSQAGGGGSRGQANVQAPGPLRGPWPQPHPSGAPRDCIRVASLLWGLPTVSSLAGSRQARGGDQPSNAESPPMALRHAGV